MVFVLASLTIKLTVTKKFCFTPSTSFRPDKTVECSEMDFNVKTISFRQRMSAFYPFRGGGGQSGHCLFYLFCEGFLLLQVWWPEQESNCSLSETPIFMSGPTVDILQVLFFYFSHLAGLKSKPWTRDGKIWFLHDLLITSIRNSANLKEFWEVGI